MLHKRVCIIFSLLFLISLVSAVPPQTQISSSLNALEIAYPKYNYARQNTNFSLDFHVFNATAIITNSSAGCSVHIYNRTGNHVASGMATGDSSGDEFEYDVDSGNFSDIGFDSVAAFIKSY